MAVEVKGVSGYFDRFETKCVLCGCKLSYTRSSINLHRNYPNGFVYCPKCKKPVAHDEANLTQKGVDYLKEQIKTENIDVKKVEKDIKKYRIPKIILLALGIPTLVVGAVLFTIYLGLYGFSLPYFIVFNVGLAMTITGGVFSRVVKAKMAIVDTTK